MVKETSLGRLAELAPQTARGYQLELDGEALDLIIWRHKGDSLSGFVNQCPHLGLPLETFPDRFLTADGTRLICSAHGAQFTTDGACIAGPCIGKALTPVALDIKGDGENKIIVLKGRARHS